MSGINISSVVSLANPVNFPVDVRYVSTSNEVIAISLEDSSLQRASVFQPLVRIYFSAVTDTLICISHITEVINQSAEKTITNVFGGCIPASITLSTPAILNQAELVIIPNPAQDRAYIHVSGATVNIDELVIIDVTGKVYSVDKQMVNTNWYEIDLHELPAGVYFVNMTSNSSHGVTRFVKL
jgi:hypothetical protein